MNFSDDELLDYLAGKLSAAEQSRIDTQLSIDDDLAARLALMSALGGFSRTWSPPAWSPPAWSPPVAATARCKTPLRLLLSRFSSTMFRRKGIFAMSIILVLGTMVFATWSFFRTPPLLQDNFNDEWIDTRLWKTARRSVKEEGGVLRLINRGSLVTYAEFPEPISLSFKWRWEDLAGDASYRDTLTVALRTSGQHDRKHPFEIVDGVRIVFQAHSGQIGLSSPLHKQTKAPVLSPASLLPMPANRWHEIRITDDGETISVYMKGPAIDPKYWEVPAIRGRFPEDFGHWHIAIYNREVVSEVPHESHIDDLVVWPLPRH